MKYLGPADTFQLEEGGKAYKRGDNVPISKELARHMGRMQHGGHRFDGVDAEARPARSEVRAASDDAK